MVLNIFNLCIVYMEKEILDIFLNVWILFRFVFNKEVEFFDKYMKFELGIV